MVETENIANIELSKISAWAKENKTRFNDQKSKEMLMTRRKRRERKELDIYLNNKLLKQVDNMKYLSVIIDSKLTFREHKRHDRKMHKINIQSFKVGKIELGLKSRSFENNIHGRHFTSSLIWCTSLGKHYGQNMLQAKGSQSPKANQH